MTIAVMMDEQVQFPITAGLRLRGVDVLTAQDDGSDGLEDPLLLDRATALGRLLSTRDADFLAIAVARQATGLRFGGIAYAKQGEATYRQCIEDLEFLAQCGNLRDVENQVYFIPLH